ncbi:MAG: NDP-sugar synthase [Candidatus Caldarchaeum sp.]|nr:NDP-sugar synthase [Candidatus Caldarchaeum sp.]MDW7978450.1 NDP-sugar synthase [Candidatus Caldarchaeum sp.]
MLKKAVIPLGGLGTRLYPLTVDTSKAMVRFLNRPLIEWMVASLARQGVREVYLAVSGFNNYIPLIDYMGGGERIAFTLSLPPDVFRVRYQPNIPTTGNAHAVKIVMDYYGIDESVVVLQGDTLAKLDLLDLWTHHYREAPFMTVVLKRLEEWRDVGMYGVAELNEDSTIKRFVEKPRTETAPSRLVNTGVYVLSPHFKDFFKTSTGSNLLRTGQMDFGRHVIPASVETGHKLYGYVTDSYWFDVGTPETYLEAVFYMLRNMRPDDIGVTFSYKNVRMQGRTAESERLHRELVRRDAVGEICFEGDVLLGRHISVGRGTRISDSIIDHYTILGENVVVENSVIMDRCVVGDGSVVKGSIVGRHCQIGRGVELVGSILGNGVEVMNEARCVGSKIWPHQKLGEKIHLQNIVSSA